MSFAGASPTRPDYDVIVVGGGAAGLSAALYLGRSRRRTLVVDAGRPRNAPSPASHGVFTRDGTPPSELLAEARRQLAAYSTVSIRSAEVVDVAGDIGGFVVRLSDGLETTARRLLLACGVSDELPAIDGLAERWGGGVLHCAYCHGFEVADRPLATLAAGQGALESVAGLLSLSSDLVLCTNGPADLSEEDRRRLERNGVRTIETDLVRVSGDASCVHLHFADGSEIEVGALFVSSTLRPGCHIPQELGCAMVAPARVAVEEWQTSVPGVYAAGDIATGRKQVAVAVASGAEAAMVLNGALSQEDFGGEWNRPLCAATPTAVEQERGFVLRPATTDDVPALRRLIPASARALSVGYYTPEQTEAAIRHVFGVDSQLIADGTYFVVEDGATIVACGGWSRRRALYGGDQRKAHGTSIGDAGDALDPRLDAARIRAFFVAPSHARIGIGRRLLDACSAAARAAGFARLELMSTRPGVPFYARLSFRAIETVTDTLPDGTTLEFVRMQRAI